MVRILGWFGGLPILGNLKMARSMGNWRSVGKKTGTSSPSTWHYMAMEYRPVLFSCSWMMGENIKNHWQTKMWSINNLFCCCSQPQILMNFWCSPRSPCSHHKKLTVNSWRRIGKPQQLASGYYVFFCKRFLDWFSIISYNRGLAS